MAFLPPAHALPENFNSKPAQVMVVPAYDVQWNRPIFRAPALSLPTEAQKWTEIPFTAQFRPKARSTK